MLDFLAERPDPILYFVAVFPLSLIALALGYLYSQKYSAKHDDKSGWAFGLGQAAVFGLIALILGFSFSFAAGRFEARRALVVTEADAIWASFLRAGFLPDADAAQFRQTLVKYTAIRLQTYAQVHDVQAERRSLASGRVLQGQLWKIASSTARSHPVPYNLELTRSVIEMINVADEQEAALSNHVPRAIIGIILLSTLVGAALLGLTFGRAKAPNALLSAIFCLLFAATVFTIIDLDHPQGGFIGVDIAPLRAILDDMTNAPESHLMRTHVNPQPAPSHLP